MEFVRSLYGIRFIRFLIAGGTGAGLNIVITFLLTHFVFGQEGYFTAFCIGTFVNFVYAFAIYTLSIFKTRERHVRRFFIFALYCVLMTALQLYLVRVITASVGSTWYLLVIASVILTGAFVNYAVFKSAIFKGGDAPAR